MKINTQGIVALAAITLLSACDSNDSDGILAPAPLPDPPVTVELEIIHAVANAPAVSIGNAGATFVSDLGFKETSGFQQFAAGTLTVEVDANVPGGTLNVIPSTELELVADTIYSVIAIGAVGSIDYPITPLVISNADDPVGAGNARVEVVHAAPGAPPVDIHLTAPNDPIVPANAVAGGSTPFGANSGPIEVAAGDYRIRVTLPGSTDPVFDSGTVALPDGADLMIIAVDNTVAGRSADGAPPITLLVSDGQDTFDILDAQTPAEVRVIHAVPDAPPVDVYINDSMATAAPAIEALAYGEVFPGITPTGPDSYVPLAAGTSNVVVTVVDNPGAIAIPETELDLAAGRQYSVYASGTLATIEPFVRIDEDRSIATEARVRVLHLAPSAGLVDIYVTAVGTDITNVDPVLEDVDFQADTGYLSLAGMAYDVTVTAADTKTIAIGPATVALSDGGIYTAVARDPDPNVSGGTFGLILLDDF